MDLRSDRCETLPYLKTVVPIAEGNRSAALCHAEHAGGVQSFWEAELERVQARAACRQGGWEHAPAQLVHCV